MRPVPLLPSGRSERNSARRATLADPLLPRLPGNDKDLGLAADPAECVRLGGAPIGLGGIRPPPWKRHYPRLQQLQSLEEAAICSGLRRR